MRKVLKKVLAAALVVVMASQNLFAGNIVFGDAFEYSDEEIMEDSTDDYSGDDGTVTPEVGNSDHDPGDQKPLRDDEWDQLVNDGLFVDDSASSQDTMMPEAVWYDEDPASEAGEGTFETETEGIGQDIMADPAVNSGEMSTYYVEYDVADPELGFVEGLNLKEEDGWTKEPVGGCPGDEMAVRLVPNEEWGSELAVFSIVTDYGANVPFQKDTSDPNVRYFTMPEGGVMVSASFTASEALIFEEDQEDTETTVIPGDPLDNTDFPEDPVFTTHSLILSGEIGVNFFMDLPEQEDEDYSDSYMEFIINGRESRIREVKFDPEFRDMGGEGYYGFTADVNAIEMAEPIEAVFHYGDGKTVTSTYSVKDYIIAYEEVQDRYDAQTTALVHAIADYGHYIQNVLSDTNGWTIGVDYQEMDKFYTGSYDHGAVAAAVEGYNISQDTGTSDINKITFSMNLMTRTQVYVYLYFNEGYEGKVEAVVDGSPVDAVRQETRYCIQTPEMSAHNLNESHTIIVTTDSGTATITVSPLDYVNLKIGPENAVFVRDAVSAVYYYYLAAQEYNRTH